MPLLGVEAQHSVRLNFQDVLGANMYEPGNVSKLLKKVQGSSSTQVTRGAACQRCRSRKIKCDGHRPCRKCLLAGVDCPAESEEDPATQRAEQYHMERRMQVARRVDVDRPITPHTYIFASKHSFAGFVPPESNILKIGFNFGLSDEAAVRMFSPMPDSLKSSLRSLIAKAMSSPPTRSKIPMPRDLDNDLDGKCIRFVARFSPDGYHMGTTWNCRFQEFMGAHQEEIATRVAACEMPQMISEYRILCYHLQLMLNVMAGEEKNQLFPMLMNHLKDGRQEQWKILRMTFRGYMDGISTTGVVVSPEEYDRAVAVRPELRSVFLESQLSGAEIEGARDLVQQETISNMMLSPTGRWKLGRLAEMINKHFRLQGSGPSTPSSGGSASPVTA